MRLIGSDPDLATIVSRIRNGDINLQPDFQRGEVWPEAKKQRLIDSVLRDWHIPPIHVIEVKESARQEVLDGQQRLVSIRDFVDGKIVIDGSTEPYDEGISSLDGLTYEELPIQWKRKFDQFTIRMFRIIDYNAGEPGELFYRLNQPVSLTAAEQRNAFFGPAREQIKDLVDQLEDRGIDRQFVGFSNSRMAYDDVLARLCCSLEAGTLREKITANILANRYRAIDGFSPSILQRVEGSIVLLGDCREYVKSTIHFNKATLYSWLWFIGQAKQLEDQVLTPDFLGSFITSFERNRISIKRDDGSEHMRSDFPISPVFILQLFLIYNDKSSARVADVLSVLSRDIVIWILFALFTRNSEIARVSPDNRISVLLQAVKKWNPPDAERVIADLINEYDWGAAL